MFCMNGNQLKEAIKRKNERRGEDSEDDLKCKSQFTTGRRR